VNRPYRTAAECGPAGHTGWTTDEQLAGHRDRACRPCLHVVRNQPRRPTAEERERLHVRCGPLPLVHHQGRAHEHVPAARRAPPAIAHTVRRRPVPGRATSPTAVVNLHLRTGHRHGTARSTVTCARRTSSGRFARTRRRVDAQGVEHDRSGEPGSTWNSVTAAWPRGRLRCSRRSASRCRPRATTTADRGCCWWSRQCGSRAPA